MSADDQLQLDLPDGTAYQPLDELYGQAAWSLAEPANAVEVRLVWYTRGKGTQDVGVAQTVRFDRPADRDRQPFNLTLPDGPHSFSGRLVSLVWAIELVVEPRGTSTRTDVVIAPGAAEIVLLPRRV